MNAPISHRTFYKAVEVQVEIDGRDLVKTLTTAELKDACRARGIALKEDSRGRKFKIMREDILNIVDLHRRGDIEGTLIALERVLPHEMRHLSEDVARFFARRA